MKKYLLILIFLILPSVSLAYTDGQLLKAEGDKVFVINNGFKHWIKNPAIFNSYGFDWNKIISVPQADLDKISEMNLAKTSASDKVYLLEGDFRKWIPTAVIFEGKGYKWADIRIINETDFNSYQIGSDLALETKYSGTSVRAEFTGSTASNNQQLVSEENNTFSVGTLSFAVNALGFENVKLSKISIWQVGQYGENEFKLKLLKTGDMHYSIATSSALTTFTFEKPIDLVPISGNQLYFTADFTGTGKYYHFIVRDLEMVGEITGLPVKYEVSEKAPAVYALRK